VLKWNVNVPEVSILPVHVIVVPPSLQPQLLHPQARLQWKRCADAPVGMVGAQAVVMGEKVYVGGGDTEKWDDKFQFFEYTITRDEWSCLPPHHVCFFAMAQFTGHLITVGGGISSGATGKLYHFKEESQEWEEFLKPMPTARFGLSVATTQSTIIASGGATGFKDGKPVPCATVEVYSSETSQWYTADPLPAPYFWMSSVTIANTCYLLGGSDADNKTVPTILYASLTSLVQKATSPTHQSASHTTVWKTLPDTPLKLSTAASLSGNLLAMGGRDTKFQNFSSKSLVLVPRTGNVMMWTCSLIVALDCAVAHKETILHHLYPHTYMCTHQGSL